jgi:PiT family inorganic phosphate transporter
MTLLLIVILLTLVFAYINGFHDTADSIATSVGTKVLTPRRAVLLATVANLCGGLLGTAVAATIGEGLVESSHVTEMNILCGLVGAIAWNLATWWFGLPSSSTHALVGGLVGSTLAAAHGNWGAIIWAQAVPGEPWYAHHGLLYKVVIPMYTLPLLGFAAGYVVMAVLFVILSSMRPGVVNAIFGRLQVASAAYVGFTHGTNDAQKAMGIVALALFSATQAGDLNNLPSWLGFLRTPQFEIASWVKVLCAVVLAAGTAAGGWRIIKTLGYKVTRLHPVHGFAAETTAATMLVASATLGMPVSTTHAISTCIMGSGAAKSPKAVDWELAQRIIFTWFFTPAATGVAGYWLVRMVQLAGWAP